MAARRQALRLAARALEQRLNADTRDHAAPELPAERVLREATRRDFTQASRCVALGDGSAWIWNTARELFPQATQILDRYHAQEALHRPLNRSSARPAKANPGRPRAARNWTRANGMTLSMLSAPIPFPVPRTQMRAVHRSQSLSPALPKISRPRSLYLHRRPRGRLQSGIGARLKRAGMHWC